MGKNFSIWYSGESCILLAAFVNSISSVFVKLTSPNLSVLEACAASSAGCLVLMFCYKMFMGRLPGLVPKDTRTGLLVTLRAGCGACTMLCYYTAVSMAGVRDATALFFTAPMFALALECLLMRRAPGLASAVGAVITSAGALLVSQIIFCSLLGDTWLGRSFCPTCPQSSHPLLALKVPTESWRGQGLAPWLLITATGQVSSADETWKGATILSDCLPVDDDDGTEELVRIAGLGLAVTAAIANAVAFVTVRHLGGAMPAFGLSFWHHFAVSSAASSSQLLLLLPTSLTSLFPLALPAPFSWPNAIDTWLVVGIMLAQLLALVLLNRGYTITSSTRGASVHVSQVVFSFLMDLLILGHVPELPSLVGAAMVIIGVVVLATEKGDPQPALMVVQNNKAQEARTEAEEPLFASGPDSEDEDVLVIIKHH